VLIRQILRVVEGGIAVGGIELGGLQGLSAIGTAVLVLILLALRPAGLTGGRELAVRHSSTRAPREPILDRVGTADPQPQKGSMT
jgi:branched-chain amino acid transport system permease protein